MLDVPGFLLAYNPKKSSKRAQLKQIKVLEKGIVQYNEEELGSGYLQISEGCRGSCSFCAENWTRKPYRELSSSVLLEKSLIMKAEMGLENIDLFSFNFNMHSDFYKLLLGLSRTFRKIGLKSQRFDMFAGDPEMIFYQQAAGKASFSCGLEGI